MTDTTIDDIRARIEGKRVTSATGDLLTLDDGTTLHLYMSASDCCAHASGEWVTHPDNLEAVITDVKIEVTEQNKDDGDGSTSTAVVTILHNQNPIAQAACYANDGNGGYYFSVLSMCVRVPHIEDDADVKVVEA